MIKMKNILAENMLRFGVKNLNESDVEKLSESLLTEAFQKNYWFDSITDNSSSSQFKFYTVNVTGNFAAKIGFKVAPNALSEPYNQDLISIQISAAKLATLKTKADVAAYLEDPKNDAQYTKIQAIMISTPSGGAENVAAANFLKKYKSWYTGTNAQGKPYSFGVNVTPNTLFQALVDSFASQLNIAA